MATLGCLIACHHIPFTAIGSCPLQHLQMATPRSTSTCPCIPPSLIGPRPFQHFHMASLCSILAQVTTVPCTALRMCPCQHLHMPIPRCPSTSGVIPGTPI